MIMAFGDTSVVSVGTVLHSPLPPYITFRPMALPGYDRRQNLCALPLEHGWREECGLGAAWKSKVSCCAALNCLDSGRDLRGGASQEKKVANG